MSEHVLSGGEGLFNALEDILDKMGGKSVSVGFMGGATYPDGTPIAAVAYWNEFGHGGKSPSPPRPFFRNMIAAESGTWGPKIAGLAKATDYDGDRVMGMIGEDIKGALQQSINDFSSPPLAPSTVKEKGFDKPLIHTGDMLRSVDYEVKE